MNVHYVKYSVNRQIEFQIKTTIFEQGGKKLVRKEAIYLEGKKHIENLVHNFNVLKDKNSCLQYVEPILNSDSVDFSFISGDSLDSLMYRCAKEGDLNGLMDYFTKFRSLLENEETVDFSNSEPFKQIYGELEGLENKPALSEVNVDLNYENIIINDSDKFKVIDYEWLMQFPVPIDYVFYRVTRNFFGKYDKVVSRLISFSAVLEHFEINSNEADLYFEMEKSFGKYTGQNWVNLSGRYKKADTQLIDLIRSVQSK